MVQNLPELRQRHEMISRDEIDIVTYEADQRPERHDLYFGNLVERFIRRLNDRRVYDMTRIGWKRRVSWCNLAPVAGTSPEKVQKHFVRRNVAMSIKQLDRYLWASKYSVLDLIYPSEIIGYLASLNPSERAYLNENFKRTLDNRTKREEATTGTEVAGASQEPYDPDNDPESELD